MIKFLYANGCSLTEGAELGNAKFGYDEKKWGPNSMRNWGAKSIRNWGGASHEHSKYMEETSYPFLLKEKLEIPEFKNAAIGGSSNRRIVRTTLADIEEALTKYNAAEILVLIGFTFMDRYEFFKLDIRWPQIVSGLSSRFLTHEEEKYAVANEELIGNNLGELIIRHQLEVLSLKHYLESKGIKYVFTYATQNSLESEFSKRAFNDVVNSNHLDQYWTMMEFDKWILYDAVKFVNDPSYIMANITHYSFNSFTFRNNHARGKGHHPLEAAHAGWAEYIYQKLLKGITYD